MSNKHAAYDLKQMQSLPLQAKIRMTQQRIQVWYESWIKYAIVNKKTGNTRFVTWTDAPFEISDQCCNVMKKKPAKYYTKRTGRKPILGTMASESRLRKQKWIQNGCNAFESNNPTSQPLSFWTEQDVLEYIVRYNVPYASVYGQIQEIDELPGQMYIDGFHNKLCTTGVDRTGCMFCMFGCHLEKSPNRFQRMASTHPKQYEYCMKPIEDGGLGLARVLDYIGVDYSTINNPLTK